MQRTMMKSKIHVISYAAYDEAELATFSPTVVSVDEDNSMQSRLVS